MNFCLIFRCQLHQQEERLDTIKEQLRDVKEQHQSEVQKNAKLEFSLRRLEEEKLKLVNQVDDIDVCITETLNKHIASLNFRLSETKNLHENERLTRERLETELKSTQSKLADLEGKADLSHKGHSEIQRALSQEKEQQGQLIENLKG